MLYCQDPQGATVTLYLFWNPHLFLYILFIFQKVIAKFCRIQYLIFSSMAQPIVRQGESSEFIWKKSEVWPRDKFFKTLCVLKWKKEKQIPQDVVVSNLSEKAFYIPPQLYTSEVYCAFPVIILMEEIDPNTLSYSAVGTQQIFIPSAVIWKKKYWNLVRWIGSGYCHVILEQLKAHR